VVTETWKLAPVIAWATPSSITYGTLLSPTQLNATANVSGTFAYSPAQGTLLQAGSQILSVTFTPYTTATASVTLQVNQASPGIVWTPTTIAYGTPLGSPQLDPVPNVKGTFVFTPRAGAILAAGEQQLSAVFTPTNSTNYKVVTVQATLVVLKAIPVITWPQPASITVGTPLSATQLDATANVPGTFFYNPSLGTKLPKGQWTLTTTFTPTDTSNYETRAARVQINVITPP
jgi:hypothetical protein